MNHGMPLRTMRFLAVLWSLATASVYTPGTSCGGATNSSGVAAMVWVGGISNHKTRDLEPKWWPKWILIKSQDKRPPTVNALAQTLQSTTLVQLVP